MDVAEQAPVPVKAERARSERPRKQDAPPTLADVRYRLEEAKKRDQARNDKFDRIERMRHRQHEIPIPKRWQHGGAQQVKVALVDDVLRTVVAGLVTALPTFTRSPLSLSQDAKADASKLEKWCTALFGKLDKVDGRHRAYTDSLDAAAMYGLAVNKLLYLPDAWDAKVYEERPAETSASYLKRIDEYRRAAPLPFAWLTPDPRTYHDWTEYRQTTHVVEVSRRARYQLSQRYGDRGVRLDDLTGRLRQDDEALAEPMAESALGGGAGESIEYVEYWDRNWRIYTADGIVLDRAKHGYERVPYFPYFGLSTSSRAPEYEAQGVTDCMLDLVEVLDRNLTAWSHYGWLSAFPMGYYRLREGSASPLDAEQRPLQAIEYDPGAFKVLPDGAEIGWVVAPQAGADLKEMVSVVRELADRVSGVPPLLRGEGQPADTAWGQSQQLMLAIRRVFNPIADNAALSIQQWIAFILWLIENKVKEPVYVLGEGAQGPRRQRRRTPLAIGPADVQGYHDVTVEIVTLTDDRRIQEGQFGLQQQQAGAISMDTHRESFLHIAAPEEEDRKVRLEQFRNSPQYQEQLWGKVMERILAQMPEPPAPPPLPPEQAQMALPPGQPEQPMPEGAMVPAEQPGGVQPIPGAPAPMAPVPGLGLPVGPPDSGPPVLG